MADGLTVEGRGKSAAISWLPEKEGPGKEGTKHAPFRKLRTCNFHLQPTANVHINVKCAVEALTKRHNVY